MVPNSVMIHLKVKGEMLNKMIDNIYLVLEPDASPELKEALDTALDKSADLLATIKNCLKHYPAGKDM